MEYRITVTINVLGADSWNHLTVDSVILKLLAMVWTEASMQNVSQGLNPMTLAPVVEEAMATLMYPKHLCLMAQTRMAPKAFPHHLED
jgi:hypothetical protein